MSYLIAILLLVTGCSGVYPVTTGSFLAPDTPPIARTVKPTVVIVGTHPVAVSAMTRMAQGFGAQVVERARLQDILDEHGVTLTNDAAILRVGRLIGATTIVFVETTVQPQNHTGAFYLADMGAGLINQTAYHIAVSIRSVQVETGLVRWQGSAWFPEPVNSPDQAVAIATAAAMERVLCEQRQGMWDMKHGCAVH